MMEEVSGPDVYEEDGVRKPLLESTASINQDLPEVIPKTNLRRPVEMSKRRVIKNVIVLSLSLFIFFLGFQALANLQSTMNSAKGLGMDSQAAIYASSMVSSLLLPELLIKKFGSKRTLVYMILFSIPYIASNFYPRWQTLIPTAVLIGLAAGPLSTSQAIYVNEMATRYHKYCATETLEAVVARFYGLFSFFSENTQIWGNLISYYVLRPGMVPIMNHTHIPCGINFRKFNGTGNDTNPNLQPPTDEKRYMLVGIYVMCGLVSAFLMASFLDALGNDTEEEQGRTRCQAVGARLLAAVKHGIKLDQLLLLPISVYCGMEIAFYTGDFTQAYIACSWGVHHVGFVTICFGVCGALMAILVGPLVKCVSQMSVIILAALINVSTCALLFMWQPSPEVTTAYFVFAGVWGMGDAIWWSQITALYGLMFPNDREAAFSNFFFWSFLGFFLSYSYANYFTVAVKINIMLVFLITGMTGYLIGQIKIKCTSKRGYIAIADSE